MEQTEPVLAQDGHKEDVRNRLLDTAEALFCKKGFDGVSVRELTAAAGCNLAAVNYYFGGKDKLYAEMFRRQFEMMIQRNLDTIERVMSAPDPTLEKLLREIIELPVRRAAGDEQGGQVMRLLIREVMNERITPGSICKDMKGRLFDQLGQAIVRFVPELPKEKVLMVVLSFDGVILHPFLFMEIYQKMMPEMKSDELVNHIVRFVTAAIRGYAKPMTEGEGH